jgi:hypothetical protein
MDEALIGALGVIIGVVIGGAATYFTTRRDAWILARARGLVLLADVRATLAPRPAGEMADVSGLLASWEAHREGLAAFRRGNFPNGFRAPEWLALAACFARLAALDAIAQPRRDSEWQAAVDDEVKAVEVQLRRFADDPRVFRYVVRARFKGKQ